MFHNKLKQFLSLLQGEQKSLLFWLVFLLGFFFISGIKSLLAWLILAVYIFFLLGWDLFHSLFFSFWVSLLFRQFLIGTWLNAVTAEPSIYLRGFSYSFGLQLAYIWMVLLVLLMLVKKKDFIVNRLKIVHAQSILLAFLVWGAVSSIFAPRLDLSLTGFISLLIGGFVFLISSVLFEKHKIRVEFKKFLLAGLMMLGLVGTSQYFLRHSLGIFIETRSSFFTNESMTTDGAPLYRVTGISPHPTFFASLLALFLLPVLGLIVDAYHQKNKLVFRTGLVATSLGLIALMATFSRSSWLAVIVTNLVMVVMIFTKGIISFDQIKKFVIRNFKKYWYWIITLGLATLTFIYQVLDRLGSLKTVWTVGNWSGRWELIKHSWQMMVDHPFVGVGLNHFPAVMVNQGVAPDYRTFIFPVHNTFLLFLSEMGIIGGGLFIIFVVLVLVKARLSFAKSWFDVGVWLGTITFIINAQFHTLFNQDPSFNIFMLFAGYLVAFSRK